MKVRVTGKWFMLLGAFLILLLCPGKTLAGDFSINVSDPDRPGQNDYEGSTINSVLSVPSIHLGDNQVLGTLRITGKKEINVPLSEGNKVMITLPPGSCFMSAPNTNNYRDYVKWPSEVDGVKNQICDAAGNPGIAFISGTGNSLIVAVANIDPSGQTTVIDFVFDKKDYSCIRVSGLCDVSKDYANNHDTLTRAEFFQRLTEITLPFPSSPVRWNNSGNIDTQFSDVFANSSYAGNIRFLFDAGLIKGYPDGTIRPMDNITRLEAGCLLGNLFPVQEYPIDSPDVPSWATGLQTVFSKGIMTGYPDGTFKPDQYLTKSEALIILQNTLEAY